MPAILLAILLSAFALAPSAEARGRDRDGMSTTRYPSCGTVGCNSRHERAARSGSVREPRAPSFRSSYGSRSRH